MHPSPRTKSIRTKALLLGATMLATGLAGAALAAEAPAPGTVDEVIVTGYRKSLADATNAKKDSTTFTDSVFAEDIGKFPDLNLAESLNRIPGIQLTREIDGEGLNIAIRGLGTNFTKITLNGSQISVASSGRTDSQNQNREVDLDMFPSELFTRLDVSKTPAAHMIEGGVAGVVDMHSARPFDNPGQHLTYGIAEGYSDKAKQWSPHGSLIASGTWDTSLGQVGVLAGVASIRNHIRVDGFETIGWTNANLICTGCNTNGGNGFNFAATVPVNAGNGLTPGATVDTTLLTALNPGTSLVKLSDGLLPRLGRQSLVEGARGRDSGLIALEWRPNDDLKFYFDILGGQADRNFNRVDMNWSVRNSNFMVPLGVTVDANNVVTKGTFANSQFFLEARPYHEKLTFYNLNPGMSWKVNDWIRVDGQFNLSKSRFFREAPSALLNTPLNTGLTVAYDNTGGNIPSIKSNANLNDPNLGWIWNRVNIQNERRVTETKGTHWDATFGDDKINVRAGVAYDDVRRSIIALDNSPAFQQSVCGGGGVFNPSPNPQPPCNGAAGSAIPTSAIASFLTPGPAGFVALDYAKYKAATNFAAFNAAAPFSASAATNASSGIIQEKTTGAYVEINAVGPVLERDLHVNGGVRYVSTEQTITGPLSIANAANNTVPKPSPLLPNTVTFQSLGQTYDAYLPSFNAVWDVASNIKLRIAASRTLTRPDPSAMLPGTTFADPAAQNANQGNPGLSPFLSTNVDVGGEYYTGGAGYVGIAAFDKSVTGFTVQGVNTQPFSSLGIPFDSLTDAQKQSINNRGGPAAATVTVTQQVNSNQVLDIKGVEITWVQPLDFLLPGSGFTANYTHVRQHATGTGAPAVAVGVSPFTYNVTGYYEGHGASIHLSYVYNDAQVSSQPNQNSVPVAALKTDARGQWDLSASYTLAWLPSSPMVTLDIVNLTAEPQRQTFQYPNAAFTYYDPGTSYTLGIRGRF